MIFSRECGKITDPSEATKNCIALDIHTLENHKNFYSAYISISRPHYCVIVSNDVILVTKLSNSFLQNG